MSKDNPARRLKDLIAAARRIPDGENIGNGWRKILGIEGVSHATLLARLAPILGLPLEVQTAIEPLIEDPAYRPHYLGWVPHVDRAFLVMRFDANWSEFKGPASHHEVDSGLTACEIELNRHSVIEALDGDRLREIDQEVVDLAATVRAAVDLDAELQAFVLKHLEDIHQAVSDCRFRGTAALNDATERATGAVVMRPELHQRAVRAPLGLRFLRMLKVLILTLNALNGARLLVNGEDAAPLLLLVDPPCVEENTPQAEPDAPVSPRVPELKNA